METTESECLEALLEAAELLGESPTKAQYEDLGLTPAASTILRVVGGWNRAKKRAGLETNPSTGARVHPKPEGVTGPDGETWADLTQDQRWHYRHVSRNTERTLERRARTRTWLYDLKRRLGGCSRCGEDDPACLDFHHLDPSEKTMAVNEMVLYGYARDRIRAEIDSCALLCANCHAREHRSLATGSESCDSYLCPDASHSRKSLRRLSQRYRARNGCRECAVADPRCLEFHHLEQGSKIDGVGTLISDGASFETVRREVEKSSVLCANCHRKAHYDVPTHVGGSDTV